MIKHFILFAFLFLLSQALFAQERIGINTNTPSRILELSGSSDQFLRVQTTSAVGGSGIEFMRGTNMLNARDWRLLNDSGVFKISTSEDEFGNSDEVLRINSSDNIGLGTTIPAARLHIGGSAPISLGSYGLMKIGTPSLDHLAFDDHEIQAWNNNSDSPLYLQPTGGDTKFGVNGGNTFLAYGGGRVGVGTATLDAALNIDHPEFQLYLRNDNDGDANDWYIGASNSNWAAGDHQLLFSPTSSSSDAALRLMDVDENDGVQAPVMIYTSYDHTLLLDGNEIDTRGTPLYINHNTNESTLVNPSGGRVGIGTTNPQALLHVVNNNGVPFTLQHDNSRWHLDPSTTGNENLIFIWANNDLELAEIDGATGQWLSASDRKLKQDFLPLPSVLGKLANLNTYSYTFKNDPSGKKHVGILAQDAEKLFPEMVEINEGQYGVAYGQLAVVGIRAIQEQQDLIDTLKEKLALLKKLKQDGVIKPAPMTID